MLLRGTIDAENYKQSFFQLLSYQHLCDVFVDGNILDTRHWLFRPHESMSWMNWPANEPKSLAFDCFQYA